MECGQNQSEHFPFSRVENATGSTFFSLSLLGTQTHATSTISPVCLAFNYSAGAFCIWAVCFVSFVLNLGSGLLSESQ